MPCHPDPDQNEQSGATDGDGEELWESDVREMLVDHDTHAASEAANTKSLERQAGTRSTEEQDGQGLRVDGDEQHQ